MKRASLNGSFVLSFLHKLDNQSHQKTTTTPPKNSHKDSVHGSDGEPEEEIDFEGEDLSSSFTQEVVFFVFFSEFFLKAPLSSQTPQIDEEQGSEGGGELGGEEEDKDKDEDEDDDAADEEEGELPSAEAQKEKMRKLEGAIQQKEGDAWYLINYRWWSLWKGHTGVNSVLSVLRVSRNC